MTTWAGGAAAFGASAGAATAVQPMAATPARQAAASLCRARRPIQSELHERVIILFLPGTIPL
jgi:hypothetical protein